MRVAYDLGDLAGMDAFTDALIGTIDQLPADEERATAMAVVAQSYMLRDQHRTDLRVGRQGHSPSPTANGFETVRLAAMVEKGSVLVIEPATAGRGRGPPAGRRRRGRARPATTSSPPGPWSTSCGRPA